MSVWAHPVRHALQRGVCEDKGKLMTEMEVTQPIIARPRTKSGTDGAAYVRSLQGERSVSAHGVAQGHLRCCSYILPTATENAQLPGPCRAYTRSTTTTAATMVGT